MPDLRDLLKAETADLHERLEKLPFFRALHAGSLPKPAIVSFLRSLSIIHAVLERSSSLVSSGPITELSQYAPPKVPLLVADLEALGAESLPSVTAAIQGALDYGAQILTSADDPLSLVGPLYVLEGSQNGGIVLKHAESVSQLSDQFDQRLCACAGLTIDSTAHLITSAWVDERSGIAGALASVRGWFVDPDRFSNAWIGNVTELVTKLDHAAKPSC